MISGHVECPPEELHFEPRCISGHEKCSDSLCVAGVSTGASKNDVVCGVVQATVPSLHAVDDPFVAIAIRRGLEICRITAMVRFGETECQTLCSFEEPGHPFFLLFFRTEITHHQNCREITHNAALILQVVMKSKTFAREMFANDCHREIACTLATELFWQCET
ncbi:unannotated protein [freshwater metagenome]|uniref:Unannotated protein n=1 Tax=freshwater metagenome TaxID=449393 RepID=A0A6J6NEF6_9ZZZZ